MRRFIAQEKRKYDTVSLEKMSDTILAKLETMDVFREAKTILLYYSLRDEVQTHRFVERWSRQKTILLPVVKDDYLELREYRDKEHITTGAFHIGEPTGDTFIDYDKIELAIVPGMAFDKDGHRLGRGKGFYDRLLPLIKATKIGICFPFQMLESVPSEPFDISMDKIITI